jgi:hypothetical protein
MFPRPPRSNGHVPPTAWLIAKAESEVSERELLAWRRMRRATYACEFVVGWAKRGLEAVRDLGFRAFRDERGALRIVYATGEERPPPAHVVKGLGRTMLGLRVDPGFIEAFWPSDCDSSGTPTISRPGDEP